MAYEVTLEYFKNNGSFNCDAWYNSNQEHINDVYIEVQEMLNQAKMPGLNIGIRPDYIYAKARDEEGNVEYPKIIKLNT